MTRGYVLTDANNYILRNDVYGMYSDTTSQTIADATVAYPITLNTNNFSQGMTHSVVTNTSRIYADTAGVYYFVVTAQVKLSVGSNRQMRFWFRKNGSDLANSNFIHYVDNAAEESITTWNYMISLAANDYVECMMSGDNTNLLLQATAADAGPPARPASPSVIVTVHKISQ